jgi:hypothetical protein
MAPTSPSLNTASVVAIEPNEPYPTGSPPDPAEVVGRVHVPQEITEAAHWEAQSEANLAAGGLIPGAAAYEPEVIEDAGVRHSERPASGKDAPKHGK